MNGINGHDYVACSLNQQAHFIQDFFPLLLKNHALCDWWVWKWSVCFNKLIVGTSADSQQSNINETVTSPWFMDPLKS